MKFDILNYTTCMMLEILILIPAYSVHMKIRVLLDWRFFIIFVLAVVCKLEIKVLIITKTWVLLYIEFRNLDYRYFSSCITSLVISTNIIVLKISLIKLFLRIKKARS